MDNVKEMLDICIEIEGLISLMAVRKENVSEAAINLLKAKSSRLELWISSLKNNPDKEDKTEADIARSVAFEEQNDAGSESMPKPYDNTNDSILTEPNVDGTVRNDTVPIDFSINDTFRFRHNLFGDNDGDMKEAIQVVQSMKNIDDVKDYLYNDLCWSPDDDCVKDFVDIISRRFN